MSNPFIEVVNKQRAFQHFHQCKNKLNDVGDELDIVYKENERLRTLVKSAYNEGWDNAMSDEGGYNEGILEHWWEMSETLKTLKEDD